MRDLTHEIEVGAREVNRKHDSKSEARITRKFYADKDARVMARRARNARVRLAELERTRVRRPPEPLRFRGFGDPSREPSADEIGTTDAPALRVDRFAVPGRLREVSFEVAPRGRLLLTGPNGSGKSTLLASVAGAAEPGSSPVSQATRLSGAVDAAARSSGTIERGGRIGYLPQETTFARPEQGAQDAYAGLVGHDTAERIPLARTGLIAHRDLDRRVGDLSAGQRRRLALAALIADQPDVLLLDEPTNHLSLTLVEELEEAFGTFDGALVIATHDRFLRDRWHGDTLELRSADGEPLL